MTGIVPEPPDPFDPLWETLAAGSMLRRVHEPHVPDGRSNDGTVFNPGFGQAMRWSFFGDPVVPVHYCAAAPDAAVHKTLLHDAVPGGHLPRHKWETKVLTVLRTVRDLRLAQLHSDGLRRFGLHAWDLTDTAADQYPRTVLWAQAAHRAGADGLVWMSWQDNTTRAYCLFGDRAGVHDLTVETGHEDSRVFVTPADAEWLAAIAVRMHVSTSPVGW